MMVLINRRSTLKYFFLTIRTPTPKFPLNLNCFKIYSIYLIIDQFILILKITELKGLFLTYNLLFLGSQKHVGLTKLWDIYKVNK